MIKGRNWTDEQLIQATKEARSWAEVCRMLNLSTYNSNIKRLKQRCNELDIPLSNIQWKRRTYTKEELTKAVASSISYRQTLGKLQLSESGGSYKGLKKAIAEAQLDISHFKGKGWNKGNSNCGQKATPLEEVLIKNSNYQTYKLKNRLLKEGVFQHKCSNCNRAKWLGGPIPIELEHKNGVSNDHRLENLTLLCPNCHALTPHYRGKNKKKSKHTG